LAYEFFQLGFTAGVFFEEPAVFLVRFQQGLPDIMRRDRHPFPPGVQKRSHKRNNYHNWAVEAKGKLGSGYFARAASVYSGFCGSKSCARP
jgi:hypothetical protein